jgi:hypothetical protein
MAKTDGKKKRVQRMLLTITEGGINCHTLDVERLAEELLKISDRIDNLEMNDL